MSIVDRVGVRGVLGRLSALRGVGGRESSRVFLGLPGAGAGFSLAVVRVRDSEVTVALILFAGGLAWSGV